MAWLWFKWLPCALLNASHGVTRFRSGLNKLLQLQCPSDKELPLLCVHVHTLYFTCASIITGKSCIQRAPLTGVARLLQNSSSTIETGPRRQRECLDLDELAHAELASMEVLWERLIVASQRSGHGLVLGRGKS